MTWSIGQLEIRQPCDARAHGASSHTRTRLAKPVVALALLAALVLSGCNRQAREIVGLINDAVTLIEQGNSIQARAKLQAVLDLDPADPDATYYLGVLRLRDGEPAEAVQLLTRSIAGDPLRPSAHYDLALAHYEMGADKAAGEALQALFKLDAGDPRGHTLAARLAMRANSRPARDRELRAAIEGDPGHAPAYLLLAELYTEVGAYKDALHVLNEGLKFCPDEVALQESLGLAWLAVGRPDRAAEVFAIAAQNARADWTTHINHGAALVQTGDRAGAAQAIERGLLMGRGRGDKAALDAAAKTLIRLKRSLKEQAPAR